jgi:CheY-like chemotaxis protein
MIAECDRRERKKAVRQIPGGTNKYCSDCYAYLAPMAQYTGRTIDGRKQSRKFKHRRSRSVYSSSSHPRVRPRLLVADDNPAFLKKLVLLLTANFDVVATAADGNAALALIHRYVPDLAVLDLDMPGLNGMEVTLELAKSSKGPPVLICSIITDPDVVKAARQAGALAYIFKTRIEQDLILAAKSVLQGKPFPFPASH